MSYLYYTISPLSLFTNMDMKRQINMHFFMSMIFMLTKFKFNNDLNNDELLINHIGT
jgi:hypothetical protein